jgi:hypothetical protein
MRWGGTGEEPFQQVPRPSIQQRGDAVEQAGSHFLASPGVGALPTVELASCKNVIHEAQGAGSVWDENHRAGFSLESSLRRYGLRQSRIDQLESVFVRKHVKDSQHTCRVFGTRAGLLARAKQCYARPVPKSRLNRYYRLAPAEMGLLWSALK